MPCPECKHCLGAERARTQCSTMVPASTYRAAGRCQKNANKGTGVCSSHERKARGAGHSNTFTAAKL